MAALSAGHGATDFANGALPALLPFFVDRFSLSYTLAAALILASAASSSLIQPLFGAWSDRRGALLLAGLRACRRLRAGRRGLSPGGLEVRGLRQRAEAGERDEPVLRRRQPRLRARADGDDAARARLRADRGAPARRSLSGRGRAARRRGSISLELRAGLGHAGLSFREGPAGCARAPVGRDRLPQRRLVRPRHLRAALGGLAGPLEGVRQPPALANAARGRARNARRGADRRPD